MGKKILIVDDEPDIVEVLMTRLTAMGYAIVTAGNGVEGMRQLKAERPDLVILDVMMPQMDGFTFVVEVKKMEEYRLTPIIVLTAKELMSDLFKMEGINDYIVKPFQADELLAKIKKYI